MSKYLPRLIDAELKASLEAFGAVVISGPQGCGKTTTASQVSKSILRLQDPEFREKSVILAKLKPSELLKGDQPRLLTEWQIAPQVWDSIRLNVDQNDDPGLYILTSAIVANKNSIQHSGTGRIDQLRMNTMSLFESGDSGGSISLNRLFKGNSEVSGSSEFKLDDIAGLIVRGGWPRALGQSELVSRKVIKSCCENIVEAAIRINERKRKQDKMQAVLRSLSRNISAPLSKKGIMADISLKEGSSISENTLNDYLTALRDIYVLDELPAWNPNLRSKTAIRTTDTVHLCDPAIAAYFLSVKKEDLLADPHIFGLLFESLVVRDLRTYAQSIGGEVFHYRDKSGLEADAVVHLHNGKWAAFEVKLGDAWVDEAAETLLKLKDRVNTESMGEPAFLSVITASDYAYTRDDGVHVVPVDLFEKLK